MSRQSTRARQSTRSCLACDSGKLFVSCIKMLPFKNFSGLRPKPRWGLHAPRPPPTKHLHSRLATPCEWWAVVRAESGRDAKPTEPCSEGADGGAGGGGGQLCDLHPAGELVGVDQVSVPRMGEEVGAGNFHRHGEEAGRLVPSADWVGVPGKNSPATAWLWCAVVAGWGSCRGEFPNLEQQTMPEKFRPPSQRL